MEDWTKSPGNLSEYECYMFCCSLLKVDWLQYADRMQIKTETISDSKLAAVLKLSQTDNTNSLPYTNSLVYLRPFYENQLHRFTADARPQAVAYARKIFHSQIQKGYLDSSNDDEVKQLAASVVYRKWLYILSPLSSCFPPRPAWFDSFQLLPRPLHFRHDLFDGRRPHEGPGSFVPSLQELLNCLL